VVRKALEFIYKGQYSPEPVSMDDYTDAHDLNGSGHNPRKRKRLLLPLGSSTETHWTNFHPSILHLRVYAAAAEISFYRLKDHAMRAVIASMGALFDHDQFAAFIQELYAQDTYRSLRAPAMDVITANLQTFKANDYAPIDDELLANVPDFRDHLLATLMDINCRKKSTISPLSADEACDCFFARATPHKVHPKDACSVFINQKFILSLIEE
jgi:hypothetical protein